MKKTRKTVQKTITAHIPVELLSQILAAPENISLCHAIARSTKKYGRFAIAHNSLDINAERRDVPLARIVWPSRI